MAGHLPRARNNSEPGVVGEYTELAVGMNGAVLPVTMNVLPRLMVRMAGPRVISAA
jgi:hypothetical protein